jgi:hypothetical protein
VDYQALNAENIERIETILHSKPVTNSPLSQYPQFHADFRKTYRPSDGESGTEFMISVGNAVYDGAEGKYRLLYRGLKKLKIPYVLSAVHNEIEDFGAGKFYRHFGPYFFSFHLEDSYFIFLDSTGQTSWTWQLRWLEEQLAAAGNYRYRFVFLNHSLFSLPGFDPDESHYVLEEKLSRNLRRLFSRYRVNAVF